MASGQTILDIQIVGGTPARFGEWPWMAYLDLREFYA